METHLIYMPINDPFIGLFGRGRDINLYSSMWTIGLSEIVCKNLPDILLVDH